MVGTLKEITKMTNCHWQFWKQLTFFKQRTKRKRFENNNNNIFFRGYCKLEDVKNTIPYCKVNDVVWIWVKKFVSYAHFMSNILSRFLLEIYVLLI